MTHLDELQVITLVNGDERYVFLYHDEHRCQLLRTFGRFAADPELSFTWYDAAMLAHKVRVRAEATT
jgi:hypothetical protein